jgi:hypothetical protein
MRNLLWIAVALCCSGQATFAQSISGTIVYERNNPLPYVNVVANNPSDSTYVSGGVTKEDGRFVLPLPATNADKAYLLVVSYIGYNTTTRTCRAGTVGTIVLTEDTKLLDEVVVVGRRIEHKANGYVVNLKNNELSRGKQAPSLLAFLPGVTEDNGAIKILSQSPHAIYVDGVKIQSKEELAAIPATQIESVEVNYLSGVSESANAKGGIIRIKLKKIQNGGYNGYLQGGITDDFNYGYYGEKVNNAFNARYGKLSIRNSISYNRKKVFTKAEEDHFFYDDQTHIYSDVEKENWRKAFYDRLSLTYDISKKHNLGVSGLYYTSRDKSHTETSYRKDDVRYLSSLYAPKRNDKYQAVMNYTWTISTGRKLSVTADYLRNDWTVNQQQTSKEERQENSYTSQNTDLLRVKPMLTLPIAKGSLSAGGDMKYAHYQEKQIEVTADEVNASMDGYQPALFVAYSGALKQRLQYEVGLRYQGNIMDVKTQDIVNKHDYWSLCPMVSVMYMLNPKKGHLLTLQYKRSIEELPYSVISTYKHYSSPQSYVVGNPNLTTPVNNELMAMAGFFQKLTFFAGLVYMSNQIYYATKVDAGQTDVSYTMPQNGSRQYAELVGIEGKVNPFKWWQLQARVNMMFNSAKTESYHVNHQAHWTFLLNNNFNFTQTFGGTLMCQYEPKTHYLDVLMKPIFAVYGSLYKTFLKNTLECKADFSLYRKRRDLVTTTNTYVKSSDDHTREQYINLAVTWYFRGGKKVKVAPTTQSIQEYKLYEDDRK